MFWEGAWFGWKAALRRMPTWGGKDKPGWGADPDCPRADMMAEGGRAGGAMGCDCEAGKPGAGEALRAGKADKGDNRGWDNANVSF